MLKPALNITIYSTILYAFNVGERKLDVCENIFNSKHLDETVEHKFNRVLFFDIILMLIVHDGYFVTSL